MENTNMNWKAFKAALLEHPGRALQFSYAAGKQVSPSYHITEIKQAPITSVDCGGVMNAWTEVIVQLWEPEEKEAERAMTAGKAMKIIDLVETKLALHPQAVVKIEFGNDEFDTRQMYPDDIMLEGENLTVYLRADATQCKATGRGQTCGKPKKELQTLAVANTCSPESGCC